MKNSALLIYREYSDANLFLECGADQFECNSGKCVDLAQRCDGKNDCNTNEENNDFSDEEFCSCTYQRKQKCIENKNYINYI